MKKPTKRQHWYMCPICDKEFFSPLLRTGGPDRTCLDAGCRAKFQRLKKTMDVYRQRNNCNCQPMGTCPRCGLLFKQARRQALCRECTEATRELLRYQHALLGSFKRGNPLALQPRSFISCVVCGAAVPPRWKKHCSTECARVSIRLNQQRHIEKLARIHAARKLWDV